MPALTPPLRTRWSPAEPVPLPEYPRPQLTRPLWANLNGWWQCAVQPGGCPAPQVYTQRIRVPFALESQLSGVQQALLPDEKLWYRRIFADPRGEWLRGTLADGRILLHFGAVDHTCEVWVNGQRSGAHTGGYLPFCFDITSLLAAGENELLVAVRDPSDKGLQQRGKQVLKPSGIWYTPVSGIWQTVWLEAVPALSIAALRLTPDLDEQALRVEVSLRGKPSAQALTFSAQVWSQGQVISSGSTAVGAPLRLEIPNPAAWSPAHPHLYDLTVRLLNARGEVLDEVGSYFAMRKFSLLADHTGCMRFALNNQPLFLFGPLDQGYFPDGLYTAPSDEALAFDIEYARQVGCNMIRKHIKVEPLRWYYHCDRLGMIVWQDMPSGGLNDTRGLGFALDFFGLNRKDTFLLGRFGRADAANRAAFRAELQGMVDHLHNSACVAVWVPFNESWGQFHAADAAAWLKAYDPTRLVDHASGWFDQGGGDFKSIHVYFKPLYQPKAERRAFVISEFGGYSLKIPAHVWDEQHKFGYRFFETSSALTEAYLALLRDEVLPLIPRGLTAAIYTQTSDVETEINGYLTYDRAVEKMDRDRLRAAHHQVTAALGTLA